MKKFAVFSDLHLHPFGAFSTINADGLNSRLVEVGQALERILVTAEKEKCTGVLFSGDYFHTKKLDVETLDLAARIMSKHDIPVYMIAGNHDMSTKLAQYHSARTIRGNVRILDFTEGNVATCEGVRIGGIPYIGTKKDFFEALEKTAGGGDLDVLLLHCGFSNALMGSDFIMDSPDLMTPDDVFGTAGIVIAGHYHQPHIFTEKTVELPERYGDYQYQHGHTLLIPGSPVQHGFGDEGSKRGFWIIEDDRRLSFHDLEGPTFVQARAGDEVPKGAYVKWLASTAEELETIRDRKTEVRGAEFVLEKKPAETKTRLGVDLSTGMDEILRKYAEMQGGDTQTLELGKKLIQEAQNAL